MIKVNWWLESIDDKVLLTNKLMDNAITRVAFVTENLDSVWIEVYKVE